MNRKMELFGQLGAGILIPEGNIAIRLRTLAQVIRGDYLGKNPILIVILKGAAYFATDLSATLEIEHRVDFMAISSYGENTESSRTVRFLMDCTLSITGQHVIIVEDIVETGFSLAYIRNVLLARSPASLDICVLINKQGRREKEIPLRYVGFNIEDSWVVGYGMDFEEKYRHFRNIWAVDTGWIKKNASPPSVTANMVR